jgi:hypothetical protein
VQQDLERTDAHYESFLAAARLRGRSAEYYRFDPDRPRKAAEALLKEFFLW